MLLFGGNITSASDQTGRLVFSNDLYAYDSASNTWEKLNVFGPRPAGRFGQTMVCDVRSRSLIVFGGASFPDQRSGCQNSSDEKPVMYAETWRFDLDADTWRQLKGIDSTLSALGLAAASDSLSGRTLVYSGASSSGKFETTAELYDVAQDRWTAEKPAGSPPARVMPALVYDPDVGGFLLYGGTQSRTGPNLSTSAPLFTYFDDVWIYKSGVTSK
jgi:N-acetylneuraminic acid mutarotase